MSWSPISSLADAPASPDSTAAAVSKHDIRFLVDPAPCFPFTPQLATLTPPRRLLPPPSAFATNGPYASSSPLSSVAPTPSCKDCNFISNTPEELAMHVRVAHRVKPFACSACDKTFAERGNANKHFRVAHLKERNHRCQTCDRCFAFRDGLNRHISMVHLNQRPFECTECMCPKGPHSRIVPCTHICGMRFKQKSHRRRHVTSVHHAGGKRMVVDSSVYGTSARLPRLPGQTAGHVS